jgi:3-methyladenine DNA glycosylase AlkD
MLERYVPVMDNWAVCDTYCANAKWMACADKDLLWGFLQRWFDSDREFEVRFAVVVSMCYFLSEEWLERVFERVGRIDFDAVKSDYRSVKGKPERAQEGTVQGTEPYYVRMGVAWLLATALAKFPEQTRKFVSTSNLATTSKLPEDVIKLYVRKARESFRTRNISPLH